MPTIHCKAALCPLCNNFVPQWAKNTSTDSSGKGYCTPQIAGTQLQEIYGQYYKYLPAMADQIFTRKDIVNGRQNDRRQQPYYNVHKIQAAGEMTK